jgi:hypothetical protein
MQEALSPPLVPRGVPLNDFLPALFQALADEGLRPCVLRNYEGFPASNSGNDIDLLIHPSELPRAIRALRSIQGIRFVGYTERPYVANVFLEGITAFPGGRSLQVDFDLSLSWKGLPYLSTETVLQAAVPRQSGTLSFFTPSPVHEAIISLFASLLVGGWLKEKYFPQVQRRFTGERSEAIGALLPQFGLKAATRLVDSVIDGDRPMILGCIRSLRVSLALRSLRHRPVRSAWAVLRHYANEIAIRYSQQTLETVCVSGHDGCEITSMIDNLLPLLHSSAVIVEKRHIGQRRLFGSELGESATGADSRTVAPSGALASMANSVLWLLAEWLSQFKEKKNLTLRICDGICHELSIDPKGRRYGGPIWFARLIGKLSPSADLWILLDGATDAAQAETLSYLDACRAFVKTRKSYIILDGSKPAAILMEEAYAAMINTLAHRADAQLMSRF